MKWHFRVKAKALDDGPQILQPNDTRHYMDDDDPNFQVYVSRAEGLFLKAQHVVPARDPRKTFTGHQLLHAHVAQIDKIPHDTAMDPPESDVEEAANDGETDNVEGIRNCSRSPRKSQTLSLENW